jgi:23S rRNA (guanosine2251-2'-O)-methyltransferase
VKSENNLIIGRKPVLEALEQGKAIDKIFMQIDISGEGIGDINREAKKNGIPIQRVPTPKLHALTRANHQGVIALGALVTYYKLQDVIDNLFANGQSPKLLWLDGITDVRNIGAIARTAKCFDMDAILLTEKGNGAINEEAVKTSAGAILDITIIREKHTQGVLEILQQNGFSIFSTSLEATKKLEELSFSNPFVIVMGAEESGVTQQVLDASTETFIIPMSDKFDSLNVSVATGIICSNIFTALAK